MFVRAVLAFCFIPFHEHRLSHDSGLLVLLTCVLLYFFVPLASSDIECWWSPDPELCLDSTDIEEDETSIAVDDQE